MEFFLENPGKSRWLLRLLGVALLTVFSVCGAEKEYFDFIIVGGGTAGCVLANRLTANDTFTVLLLEGGGRPSEDMDIPALTSSFQSNPNLTYRFHSVPQTHAALATDGITTTVVGRVLGGTSSVSNMRWNRGCPIAYDTWAATSGDPSWKYSNMLTYFKRTENYIGDFASDQHGFDGPIAVSEQKYAPGLDVWISAGRELGFKIWDPNGPQKISFTPIDASTKSGRRVSSYTGYLEPVESSRRNLKVVTNAAVTQVLFEGDTAIGVKYNLGPRNDDQEEDTVKTVYVNKEVIISAGAIGSPVLLMRSGIGPREILKKAGIHTVVELPVGDNLVDSPVLPLQFVINNKSLVFDPEKDLTPENYEHYLRDGEGVYATSSGFAGQAFISSSIARAEGYPDWADLELLLQAKSDPLEPFKHAEINPWESSVLIHLFLSRSKSSGSVTLNPNDIHGPPIIDWNLLEDPLEEEILLDGINTTLAVFLKTVAYGKLGARYLQVPLPQCSHLQFRTEAYWRCYIRLMTTVGNHPGGTCALNKVVDSTLRVIGTKNLRVADAAVVPVKANVNLLASVYAIAEKASESILNDWL